MPDETPAVGRIRLTRSPRRILIWAGGMVVAMVLSAASALLGVQPAALFFGALAALLAVAALYLTALTLSVRVDMEVAALRVRWLGGERRYALVPGPVTRIPLGRPGSPRLRFEVSGVAIQRAILRDEERIEVIRFAPTPSLILVPTHRGRLAIAPASEEELLATLAATARVKQRLDQATGALRMVLPSPAPEPPVAREVESPPPAIEAVQAPAPPAAPAEPQPRYLTGIERARLEELLAEERAAAAAAAAAAIAEGRPVESPIVLQPVAAEPARRRRAARTWRRPGWFPAIPRPGRRFAMTLLPAALAGLTWLGAVALQIAGAPGDDDRLLVLALALGGPAATIGALLAWAFWPRLAGLVVVTALGALLIVVRAVADRLL